MLVVQVFPSPDLQELAFPLLVQERTVEDNVVPVLRFMTAGARGISRFSDVVGTILLGSTVCAGPCVGCEGVFAQLGRPG